MSASKHVTMKGVLEKLVVVSFDGLKFPLDGDSSEIYGSDKKPIECPAWMVAELLNALKDIQDEACEALSMPQRNCELCRGVNDSYRRFQKMCNEQNDKGGCAKCHYKFSEGFPDCYQTWLFDKEEQQ